MSNDHAAWLERVRATWNERAPFWDEFSERNAVAPDRPADLARIGAALELGPASRLLDAGCGSGQWALAFADAGCRVTAIDLAPDMLDRARRHADERGLDVEFRLGDVSRIADPIAVYDAIFARVVLQFVPDPMATLQEFRRVLKPGGRLLASVPGSLSPIYAESWRRFVEPERFGTTLMVPWELEQLLTTLGWRLLDGWGNYGPSGAGDANPFSPEHLAALPTPLQQAAATIWTVIAA